MSYSLLILILIINSNCIDGTKMGIGTVLFTESDNSKDCWSNENIALLTSRMMLEDILPDKTVLVFQESEFITDIIDYFRFVLEIVRQLTSGKTKHVLLLALTDTLGGYLNKYVLPMAKQAFYAGYVDFDSMENLYKLFNELKNFLRTNGHGWASPEGNCLKGSLPPQPLTVNSTSHDAHACDGLIYYQKSEMGSGNCTVGFPMPFYDSRAKPTAIAMPFNTFSLRNVESREASYVLVKFYLAAVKCIASKNVSTSSIDKFGNTYFAWLHSEVIPHMCNEKFYSAYGGVLRVIETLKKMGAKHLSSGKEINSYNIIPDSQIKEFSKEDEQCGKHKKSNLILMALLATIFIWFILGTMFICYRIKASKSNKQDCSRIPCPKQQKSLASSSRTTSRTKTSSKLTSKSFRPSSSSTQKKQPSSTHSTGNTKKSISSVRGTPVRSDSASPSGQKVSPYGSSKASPHATHPGTSSTDKSSKSEDSNGSCVSLYSKKSGSRESKRSSKTSGSRGRDDNSTPVYPTSCACHPVIIPGKYKSSSSEDFVPKPKQPFVFGYELETSTSAASTPRDPNEDMYATGNMSK